MKGLNAVLFIALLISACNPLERSEWSPEAAIPENAVFILKINDPSAVIRDLKNNEFSLTGPNEKSGIRFLEPLHLLEAMELDKPGYLVALPNPGDSLSYMYISRIQGSAKQPNETLKDTVQRAADSINTPEIPMKSSGKWYAAEIGNVRFTSPDSALIANKKKTGISPGSPEALMPLLKSADQGKVVSFFVDSRKADSLLRRDQKEEGAKWSSLARTVNLDLNLTPDSWQWTGVGIADDSIPSLLSLFSNTQPVVNTLASLAPQSADGLLAISFSDHTVFSANQNKVYPRAQRADSLFTTTEEVGIVFKGKDRAVIVNTYGALSLSESLQMSRSSSYEYQGKEIGVLAPDPLLQESFPSLVQNWRFTHYAVFDNAFIFSDNRNFLELIIRDINSENTFDSSAVYQSARSDLAEASSLLLLADKDKLKDVAAEILPPALLLQGQNKTLPDHIFAFQVVADRSFCHLNSLLKRKSGIEKKKGVVPRFTAQLDAPLATVPQFVTDHRNGTKEIVVQDNENNLYLISTDGKVLWKKKLEGRVQGRIEQIDLYKNGRLQLAFTTSNQFLVLDRNGKEVAPFDLKFSGPVLNPLAVFDYEGNRNYRFLVTQGRDVRMYNGKGNIVTGFKYTKAESAVLDRPRHFRIGSRDYLVFKLEDGSLKILNRVGDTRVNVSERIDFSENDVYIYNDKFIVTDKTGTLFSVDTRGKITRTRFNLAEDHGMDATVKTLSLMNDNVLTIKGNTASLDLGVYTKPRIFYIYDKIYVSVTDIQTQRAYLFDSNAIPFAGFPVYANSPVDLSDMDNDRKVEIAAKFEENSLIVYSLN
jgi:hypothetical protein